MKKIFAFFIIASSLINIGCERIEGSGDIIEVEIKTNEFSGIQHSITGNIYFTQSDKYEVFVEAQENIIEIMTFNVVNEVLHIDIIRGYTIGQHEPINIYVSTPELKLLELNGSGTMYSLDPLIAGKLRLNLNGSGSINIEHIEAAQIISSIDGSGNITITGYSDYHNIDINGSGNINTFELETNSTNIEVDGSGYSRIWVNEMLKVRIMGSGSVHYLGNPDLDVQTLGSGRVINNN